MYSQRVPGAHHELSFLREMQVCVQGFRRHGCQFRMPVHSFYIREIVSYPFLFRDQVMGILLQQFSHAQLAPTEEASLPL